MFGVVIVEKLDVRNDIVNAILDKRLVQLNAIVITVKMVKMKICITKLENKMNYQNNQKDKDLIGFLIIDFVLYCITFDFDFTFGIL